MKKRERLEKTQSGELVDRMPVALWRHWPGDDQRIADFVWSTLAFQKTFDWDFVKVTPFSAYCVTDYGVQTEWRGEIGGDRTPTKYPVKRSLAWTELRTLDPLRGEQGKHIEAIRLIGEELQTLDTPFVTTIYSPLTQASMLAGGNLLLRHLRTRTDRLRTALNIITENTLRFIDALRRTHIAGIFYEMHHADFTLMSEEEYRSLSTPYDLKILGELPSKWWLNFSHLPGNAPMFALATSYQSQGISWDSHNAKPSIDRARAINQNVLCGGVCRETHLHRGTPAMIRDVAREIADRAGTRRLVLAAGGAVPVSTPLANLRAMRDIADELRMS
jgi:uroporphyrinogen decarboxylase